MTQHLGLRTQDSTLATPLAVLLARIELFAHFTPAQIGALLAIVRRQRFARRAVIVAQGEVGEVAFFVLSGSVDIFVTAPDGRQFLLAELGPLECFGEMALLDEGERHRSANAVAREETELALIRRDDFLALLDQYPRMARQLLHALSRRLRQANEKISGLAFADVGRRLACQLLTSAVQDGDRLLVRATHEELAAMTGAARQTVTRVLNTWRRDGYLATGREQLLILDLAAMREIADGEL